MPSRSNQELCLCGASSCTCSKKKFPAIKKEGQGLWQKTIGGHTKPVMI